MADERAQVAARAAVSAILALAETADDPKTALLALARLHKGVFKHGEVYLIWYEAWMSAQHEHSEPRTAALVEVLETIAVYGPSAVGVLYEESPKAGDVAQAKQKFGFDIR